MYPNGLDDPEGTGNIAFATNTGNGSGAKVPSASLGKYLYSRQFMEGCIKTVLGRFFLSMLGGGFKHVCMFNPHLGKSLMLTIVFFQMGWFNEPPKENCRYLECFQGLPSLNYNSNFQVEIGGKGRLSPFLLGPLLLIFRANLLLILWRV